MCRNRRTAARSVPATYVADATRRVPAAYPPASREAGSWVCSAARGWIRLRPAHRRRPGGSGCGRHLYCLPRTPPTPPRGDTVVVELRKRPRRTASRTPGTDRRGPRAGDAPVRRHLLRGGRHGLRADRRHALRPADLRRRPGAQETPGRTTKWSSRWSASPRHFHDGEGVIAEVLGPRGKPGVDTLSIIREFDLPERVRRGRPGRGPRRRPSGSTSRFPRAGYDSDRPRRSSRSIRSTPAISTTPSPWSSWPTATGGWACTLPTCRISSGRGRPWTARPSTGHQRLSARPRAAHAAGGDLQRPGQPAAGQGPLHQDGLHGVHARGPADPRRVPRRGHPQQPSG